MVAYRYGISLLVFNSKRNSISTRTHVLFAIYLSSDQRCFWIKVWPPIFLAIFCTAIYVDLSILNGLAHFCRLWDHLYALGQYEYSYEQKKKGRVRNRVYVLKSCNKRVVLNVDWKLIAISLLERHVRIKAYRVRIICLQNHKHLS